MIVTTRGGVYDVVKLLDFGLAKPVADEQAVQLTQEGTIAGTPRFISPEQCTANGRVDARSDIYSLGALAYVLLTGRPPFNQASPVEVVIAHLHEQPLPLSQEVASVPEDLEAIVMRCLAKPPEDRFPNVEQLDAALSACRSAGDWTQDQARTWWLQVEARSEPAPTGSSVEETQAVTSHSNRAS